MRRHERRLPQGLETCGLQPFDYTKRMWIMEATLYQLDPLNGEVSPCGGDGL
ncbi:MAG: hypothetical protein IJK15_02155 [Bacteroidaceae bacterium]|nr:hypothetical protein [Bacteroidaceae bacterium]